MFKRGKMIQTSKLRSITFIAVIFLLSLSIVSFALAAENDSSSTNTQAKQDKAYKCLENKVSGKCSSLSLEQQIFSLLALGYNSDIQTECKEAIINNIQGGECLPASKSTSTCSIKTTAQAILALKTSSGYDTSKMEDWLLSQKGTPDGLTWFLQIDTSDPSNCKVSYDSQEYRLSISDDKKLSSGAGTCLQLSPGKYWLAVSQNCYGKIFTISCDKSFITNLLYKKSTSTTIFVSEKTSSASPEGKTTETVKSYCFKQGGSCDYEGSLWAALALTDDRSSDVESFTPYLIALAEDNGKYLPESFLYILTGYQDFYTTLLGKQKISKYWDESNDKFYDTAAALMPFSSQQVTEKTNSINWLFEIQDTDGCWQGDVRNTAFLLYSLWPKQPALGNGAADDCEESNYYCLSLVTCSRLGGEEKEGFFCPGSATVVCCSENEELETCGDQGGIICSSEESCSGSSSPSSDVTEYGEECCLQGECNPIQEVSDCEAQGNGMCKVSCSSGEQASSVYSCSAGDSCCVAQPVTPSSGISWTWIIILIILIIIVALAIIFRDKLRPYWYNITGKFKKGKGSPPASTTQGPRGFPPSGGMIRGPQQQRPMMMPQRRILPPGSQQPMRRPMPPPFRRGSPADKSFNDTLKKLKDMK